MTDDVKYAPITERGAVTNLRDLPKGQSATIIGFATEAGNLQTRLREIGFAEGDRVEALHFGLFGRNPMTVKLNGALIAMRKAQAQAILVEVNVEVNDA